MNGIPFIITYNQVSYMLYFVAIGSKKTTMEIHLQGKNYLLKLDELGVWKEISPDPNSPLEFGLILKMAQVFKSNFH
jgi:hypothetical protein